MTPVKHMAVNLGAPGDRRDAQGTLWLGYPRPRRDRLVLDFDLHDEIQPGGFYYRYNAEGRDIRGTDKPWVFSSWCRGLRQCSLSLIGGNEEPNAYTVRLCFAELEDVKVGERLFSVALQGSEVLTDFDVVREAGGANLPVVKQFKGVRVTDSLKIALTPSASARVPAAVLCGIEVMAER